ncbi:B12-binding domain-containing radical SAM protein [candidate division CSSED10-310 bacterium]|uniref:B12-binding domain-containing radical SAM protein n=1 Tax=candidate division CSSED10-310 bacterium TaxID=2855610 RepID=A0ABV6YWF7_UNCC1
MKILLTVPLYPFRYSHPPIPDLGLGSLAAVLIVAGHQVAVNDWNDRSNLSQLSRFLTTFKPEVVGIKFLTLNVAAAKRTVAFINSVLNDRVIIVLGGPHSSAEDKKWLSLDFPEAHGRFLGEAEKTIVHFTDLLQTTGPDQSDRLVAALPKFDGFEPFTANDSAHSAMTVVEKLDSLPFPAWELIDPRKYPGFSVDGRKRFLAPIMASRGCPQGCKFCGTARVSGQLIRRHSPEYLIDLIDHLKQHFSVSAFSFLDPNFMTDTPWLSMFLEKLNSRTSNIVWDCIWQPNPIQINKSVLLEMRQAGCRVIIMGIETGNDSILQQCGKRGTVDMFKEQVETITESGINVHGFFMLGFPGESYQQIQHTINFALSLPLQALSLNICYPLPGTEYYDWLRKKYSLARIDWSHFNIYRSPFPMSQISSLELARIRRRAQVRNILQPGKLYADLKRGLLTKDVVFSQLKKWSPFS